MQGFVAVVDPDDNAVVLCPLHLYTSYCFVICRLTAEAIVFPSC